MTKPLITKLFVGAVAAVIAGIVLCVAAFVAALAGNVFVMDGPDVVGVTWSGSAWAMVVLGLVGVLAILGGAIAGLVSWIGALLNTAQLEDKLWFVLLLVLGLFSFGVIAMIAYVLAGPDGTREGPTTPHIAAMT
jgi:H+/Cl- antiporter ClcA